MQKFLFRLSRNAKTKKKSCVEDYFLHTTPPFPFKYGYSFMKLKQTHYIGMELQAKFEQV